MKLRLMGTEEECREWADFFLAWRGLPGVRFVEVSEFYANRPRNGVPSNFYRGYVDIQADSPLLRRAAQTIALKELGTHDF